MKIRKELFVFLSFTGLAAAFLLAEAVYGYCVFGRAWTTHFLGAPHPGAMLLRALILLAGAIVGLVMALYHFNVLKADEMDHLDRQARHAGRQRQRLETFLGMIMQRSFDGIALCRKDAQGHVRPVMFNDRYAEMTGMTREQLEQLEDISPCIEDVDLDHDDLTRREKGLSRCGISSWKRPDAQENYFEWSSTPVPLDEGMFFIDIARDITDRRRMEQQFYHAQKMETVWRLAGGLAHDFNNQLTVIRGYCDLLKMQGLAEGETGECISEIYKATEAAGQLTGKILSYSRSRSERMDVIDVAARARQVAATVEGIMHDNISLTVDIAEDCGSAKVDPVLFEQALLNLLNNALDAMPDGGVLTLRARSQTLGADFVGSHLGGRMGPHCVVEVCDTGEGMDDEVLGRIFEPFFSTKGKGKGTGLGLAMVYSFVRQSGGHLDVHSELDQGSVFRVFLPCVTGRPAGEASDSENDSTAAMPSGSETVLIAEDEVGVLRYITEVLKRCGYKVLEGGLPEKVMETARRHDGRIDLLVTDIVMPGMMGPQLADAIRLLNGDMRVLYVSGYPERLAAEIRNRGNFLGKPFDSMQLARVVRSVLDRNEGKSSHV